MELRSAALEALRHTDPTLKCEVVAALAKAEMKVDVAVTLEAPPDIPGRPARPHLVMSSQVPQRGVLTLEGRAALLHAVAHIEFNAIGLALDAVWRFARMPESYYRDWLCVAAEEAQHFSMLRERLRSTGYDYGDFNAHDGLWEMARKTSDDVLARMAMVPRTLEARGLDASPQVRAKFMSARDPASAAVIDVILRDEIGHVAIGNHWFRWLCAARGLEPKAAFAQISAERGAPRLRGAINVAARLEAGFEMDELETISMMTTGTEITHTKNIGMRSA